MVLAGNFRKIEIMKPYRKIYDSRGVLTNPITKNEPYLHPIQKSFANMFQIWHTYTVWTAINNKFFKGKTPTHYS